MERVTSNASPPQITDVRSTLYIQQTGHKMNALCYNICTQIEVRTIKPSAGQSHGDLKVAKVGAGVMIGLEDLNSWPHARDAPGRGDRSCGRTHCAVCACQPCSPPIPRCPGARLRCGRSGPALAGDPWRLNRSHVQRELRRAQSQDQRAQAKASAAPTPCSRRRSTT
jgi:hypothetical protein